MDVMMFFFLFDAAKVCLANCHLCKADNIFLVQGA
jgi:hypothetical protein